MANITPGKQLSDLLITRNFETQALDAQGKPATDPDQAKMFSFDYSGESGKDYGTVVAMLDEDNNMSIYFGDNVGKNMESDDKKSWFDFLYQLRQYAKRNLMSFSLQNLNKLKYSMQGQAAIKEGLFESWAGKKDLSWNAPTTEARLMIKHKRAIGEGEARFRYVESLFIETADGERFKMPFKSLTAGKAMLEHVRQGGRPYDIRGQHITTIVEEMNLLARFRRANQGRIFEGETQQLVEQATEYLGNLQQTLKSLTSKAGYKKYFESWNPAELRDEDVIIEDLRHMFVEQNIDSRVEQALPVLARLKQETAMKEMNVFESWINLLSEGTWALPDTTGKQQQLITLLSQELPVGPDATNAQEQLYDLLGDDELFDRLEELAEQDPDADARTIILNRLEQMKSNPAVAQVIGKLKIETNPAEQPDQPAPAAQTPLRESAGDVMFHDQDRLDRLETLRMFAKTVGNMAKAEELDRQIKAIYAANPVGSRDDGHLEEEDTCHVCHKSESVCECGVYEGKDEVKRDPKTGKPVEWSHEGDWEKIKGKGKDPRGEVTHMSDKERRKAEKLDESGMSEADILLQQIARGEVDIYDIYANPKSNIEKFISDQIHEKAEEAAQEQNLNLDDDIEDVLQRVQRELEVEYGVDDNMDIELEGNVGRAIGTVAGMALAPEVPGSGMIGGYLGDKIGDRLGGNDEEVDETVGGGNWLEETDAAGALSYEDMNETTALTGQYGHSGKLQAVKPQDADMMDRIKFLAGVTK